MKTITKTAHGKLILIGEHSVVYGEPAIAIPLPHLVATAQLSPNNSGQYLEDVDFKTSIDQIPDQYIGLHILINRLIQRLNIQNKFFTLKISNQIPRSCGLGSSAAISSAITKCFFAFCNEELSKQELNYFINIAETVFHGNPSGLDAATVTSNQAIWFIKNKQLTPFNFNLHASLVIVSSGIMGNTATAVNLVKDKLENQTNLIQETINKLGTLTEKAAQAMINNQIITLGEIFNQAQVHLTTLGVNHPKLQKLIDIAHKHNSLGAKLSGSGLGGCIFALFQHEDDAALLQTDLKNNGFPNVYIENI